MGLDSVELIMEFEKAFGIEIPDRDAEQLTTVGSVHEYIYKRIAPLKSNHCITQIIFYKLRRYCSEYFGISKNRFSIKTNLNEVFPLQNRREEYKKFSNDMELAVPDLALNNKLDYLLQVAGMILIGGSLLGAFLLTVFFSYSGWLFLLPVAGMIITFGISQLLNPFRKYIRPYLAGDFTSKLVSLNYSNLSHKFQFNKAELISVINQIIVDKIGVDMEEVLPEKSFTDDLGVD